MNDSLDTSKFDLIIKLVVCGNSGVGKTKILNRYLKNTFEVDSKATIGVDFFGEDIKFEDQNIKIQFFDTAGQEKYRSICSSYYKNCNGILLVYDITDRESFEKLNSWLIEIKSNLEKKATILLIGNKTDLEKDRKISKNEGNSFAEENKIFFMETSAKTNDDNCVNKAFEILVKEITKDLKVIKDSDEKKELAEIRKKAVKFNLDEGKLSKLNTNPEESKCPC